MDDPIRNDLDAIAVGSFAFLRLEQRLHLADVAALRSMLGTPVD